MQNYRCNHAIRVPQVRLIGEDGEQVGIVPTSEALTRARGASLDLVEISPQANPPVCKIMDFGKFTYQQAKKEKEHRKSQHQAKLKEIRFSYNISKHDLDHKMRQAREFLEEGNSVRISCILRGRQVQFAEEMMKTFKDIESCLGDISIAEVPSKMEGRMVVAHFKTKVKKENKSG